MNKAEFIDLVKEAGKYNSKREAEEAISAFTLAVETALSKGESVELIGFGKFETAEQKGKEGKVPGSDKTYKTEDKRVPKFKPGKTLKQKVEEGKWIWSTQQGAYQQGTYQQVVSFLLSYVLVAQLDRAYDS